MATTFCMKKFLCWAKINVFGKICTDDNFCWKFNLKPETLVAFLETKQDAFKYFQAKSTRNLKQGATSQLFHTTSFLLQIFSYYFHLHHLTRASSNNSGHLSHFVVTSRTNNLFKTFELSVNCLSRQTNKFELQAKRSQIVYLPAYFL